MIVHAKVSKLYRHLHDDEFSKVMRQVEGALDEGLDYFKLDVMRLEDSIRIDLLEALDVMGYEIVYDTDTQEMEILIGN